MQRKFIESVYFLSQIKQLRKKYPHIEKDRSHLKQTFDGTVDADLGSHLAKIRLKNSSIPTGKRGGFRVIVHIFFQGNTVRPLLIYAKQDKITVTHHDIAYALERVLAEEKTH